MSSSPLRRQLPLIQPSRSSASPSSITSPAECRDEEEEVSQCLHHAPMVDEAVSVDSGGVDVVSIGNGGTESGKNRKN